MLLGVTARWPALQTWAPGEGQWGTEGPRTWTDRHHPISSSEASDHKPTALKWGSIGVTMIRPGDSYVLETSVLVNKHGMSTYCVSGFRETKANGGQPLT